MRLLLDTNALLWWLDDPSLVAPPARSAIADSSIPVAVSAVTAFEIHTKASLGKLAFDGDLESEMAEEGFDPLPMTFPHAVAAGSLPLIHRDPFDRLLVGQAQVERMTLVTRDRMLPRYGVPVLRA